MCFVINSPGAQMLRNDMEFTCRISSERCVTYNIYALTSESKNLHVCYLARAEVRVLRYQSPQ